MSAVVPTEETIRKTTAGCDRDGCQRNAPRDIANREDVRHIRALPGIRRDEARGVEQYAYILEIEASRRRISSDSPDDGIEWSEPATIVSSNVVGVTVSTHQQSRHHAADDVDATVCHFSGQRGLD